ncbi:DODA-type extradiol aromatic ring-opening family dioxygenase [Novosphingobium subterraneum]|uniref:DODA-type extradiol aromatic ring-opening family dioxygenase n=1 Tax=Novosphingobium subterraneum TaxID=48936 RepID=UPI003D051435
MDGRPDAADIPVVQLSVLTSFDAAEHIAMGRLLAPLREEGVLVLGSGLSYHNLRNFGVKGQAASHAFDRWLRDRLSGVDGDQRAIALERWMDGPAAMQAHPRPEHLLPLHVIAGAAGADPCSVQFHQDDFFGGLAVTSFRFG